MENISERTYTTTLVLSITVGNCKFVLYKYNTYLFFFGLQIHNSLTIHKNNPNLYKTIYSLYYINIIIYCVHHHT